MKTKRLNISLSLPICHGGLLKVSDRKFTDDQPKINRSLLGHHSAANDLQLLQLRKKKKKIKIIG